MAITSQAPNRNFVNCTYACIEVGDRIPTTSYFFPVINKSRYSAQILICFIAYIFHFLFICGLGLELPSCTVPTVHCNQNEAGHQPIKAPSMPCWGAAGPHKHSLAFMPQDSWSWQIKYMKSVSMRSYQYINQVNRDGFLITESNFTVFQPRI